MILNIGSQTIYFPFDEISPEQIQLMFILEKLWKKKGNGVIGIPPTVDLSPVIMSFYFSCKFEDNCLMKLVYVTDRIMEAERIIRKNELYFKNTGHKLGRLHQRPVIQTFSSSVIA